MSCVSVIIECLDLVGRDQGHIRVALDELWLPLDAFCDKLLDTELSVPAARLLDDNCACGSVRIYAD